MILNYCKKKEKKIIPYCPKLYGAKLESGTFEFVTYLLNDLTNYAIDYLWILKFSFWINSVHWTHIIFRHLHVHDWHILRRFWITIKNYKLKIKSQKNFNTKTWKKFQIFKIGLKLSQICQFMEKYLKIGIFSTLRRKKIPREKLKTFKSFRN